MIRKMLVSILVAFVVALGAAPASTAADLSSLYRTLATSPDFRVRVAAALGLGTLGDADALAALKSAAGRESTASVKSAMQAAVRKLSRGSAKARFLVAVGTIKNESGVSGPKIASMLKSSARSKAAQVPGVELLADGSDLGAASRSRGLPAFAIDGKLVKLSRSDSSGEVGFSAKVEFLVRKVPEQALKGTMRGSATALGGVRVGARPDQIARLQIEAVSAAVESAMKGCKPVLEASAH